jgi:glutathione S-transferase
VLTLYDAAQCPYCARVRIVLAEKQARFEPVEIDLADRPTWLFEKNPLGKVPVLEENDLCLPESRVIMEYLEDRFPAPGLGASDPVERARMRLWFERFDAFSSPYYRVVFEGAPREELEAALAKLDEVLTAGAYLVGSRYSLADIAYVPWILRAGRAGIDLGRYSSLSRWLGELSKRPAVAAEVEHAAGAAR